MDRCLTMLHMVKTLILSIFVILNMAKKSSTQKLCEVHKARNEGAKFDTVCINHLSEGVTSNFRCQQGVKQGCPLSPLLFGLYLDALEGRLDNRECDAPTLVDVHIWLLLLQMTSL